MANTKPISFMLAAWILSSPSPTLADEITNVDQPPEYYAESPRLREYVDLALDNNPSIQGVLARYRAALKRVPQVRALPDPMFGFTQAIRSVETRVGPQRNAFVLSQAFPWFGKLDLKGKVSLQEAVSWYQRYRARQRELISQLKVVFYELGYIDAAIRATEEEKSLLEHYEGLAQNQYASGQGLQHAVLKVQAEITRVISRLEILRQQRYSLAANLNTLVDRSPDDPVSTVEILSLPPVELNLEELYALGEQNRHELKATQALMEGSEKAIDLVKKNNWPDLTVSATFINVGDRSDPTGIAMPPPDNGKNAFSLSVGITLPIWRDKYDAEVEEAAETLVAQRNRYADVLNEMEFSVRDQAVRLETLRDQIDLYESALIPQAEETLRSTEAAYQTGQLGVLDLLDSERVLLNARLVNARYCSDFLAALARLEKAVGTKYPK
jgi:outer membrane protein TolC